jgi:hypothetical protein
MKERAGLGVVQNVAQVMEQSPSAFVDLPAGILQE